MDDTLNIGEAAELLGVTTKALRHYEKIGLVAPHREENGYRTYRPEDILRLQRIRQLQSLGLSLERIKLLLNEHPSESLWGAVLESLLDEVEAQMDALADRRRRIEGLLTEEAADPLEISWQSAPRVQEYLEKHLPPQMWVQAQAVSVILERYRQGDDRASLLATAEMIVHLAQFPDELPVGTAAPLEWSPLTMAAGQTYDWRM